MVSIIIGVSKLKRCNAKILIRSVYLLLVVVVMMWVLFHNFRLQDVVKSSISEFDNLYTPGDSRLFSVSTILHDMVQFNSVGIDISSSVSIYDWNGSDSCEVSLDAEVVINKEEHIIHPNAYEHWAYYLHPTSTVSGTVCSHKSTLKVYIVKGENNMSLLEDAQAKQFHRYVEKDSDNQDHIVHKCPNMTKLNYTVNEEDYYYIMISNYGSETGDKLDIKLKLKRCQYQNISEPLCVITPYQSREIPLTFGYDVKFLVTTSNSSDNSCKRELQKVVIQYHYRLYFFIPFFILVFCLIELFYAFPQYRYYTASAMTFIISLLVGTETDVLSPSFY